MKKEFKKSFTLVDTLIGVFLLILIFVGIYGGYRLMLKTLNQARIRTVATYLCTEKIEEFRNLSYEKIGTEGGYPSGDIPQTETKVSNGVTFTIRNKVDYVADEADGLTSPDDNCPNDYKKVTVTVSWGEKASQKVSLSTIVSPENEVQECEETGGILWVNVFDASGQLLDGVSINIKDINSALEKECTTSSTERCYIILPPSGDNSENYKITVSKSGYSSEETFKIGDTYNSQTIVTPQKPNATIFENEVTKESFSIDKLSSLSIKTMSSRGKEEFLDDFSDASKISDYSQVDISGEEVTLSKTGGNYYDSGYLVSETISPLSLYSWGEFSFLDSRPENTNITYQILYENNGNWEPIPDTDLPENEEGFTQSPVDLSSLDTSQYSQIRLKGTLSTSDVSVTPSLSEWKLSYYTKEPHSIGNTSFHIRGDKIVGKDANDDPIYKYEKDLVSDDAGNITISSLEWDNYYFSENGATGMNLVEVSPSQPVSLSPDTTQSVTLYFESQNSLLVTVKDSDTLDPILDASVRLYNGDYDRTYRTDSKGQAYFAPLDNDTYNLEVTAEGYESYSGQISVLGETTQEINLTLSPQ